MQLLPLDERLLATALGLARSTVGLASPNPTVGCVIAAGEAICGEGAHFYDAFDHAEIAALKQSASLSHDVHGATAYVTLEPCSHHGRTGPCSDALIAAGISRCIVATVDPNPLVSGRGIAKLRAANVEVILLDPASPLATEARTLNDAFAHFIQHRRPFITLKAALSVDGKLAPPPSTRTATAPHWITGPAARNSVHPLRHEADAILTGIGTVLADNPSLTDRTGLPRRRPLLRVILDSELRIPLDSTLLHPEKSVISTAGTHHQESVSSTEAAHHQESVTSTEVAHHQESVTSTEAAHHQESVISTEAAQHQESVISTDQPPNLSSRPTNGSGETPVSKSGDDLLLVCSTNASVEREAALNALGAQVLRVPSTNGQLDLNTLFTALADRAILSVLVEAGATLNGALLHANLVDKLVLYYAERELGLNAIPFAIGYDSPYAVQQRLTRTTRSTFANNATANSEDIRITGYLHDPWLNAVP